MCKKIKSYYVGKTINNLWVHSDIKNEYYINIYNALKEKINQQKTLLCKRMSDSKSRRKDGIRKWTFCKPHYNNDSCKNDQ